MCVQLRVEGFQWYCNVLVEERVLQQQAHVKTAQAQPHQQQQQQGQAWGQQPGGRDPAARPHPQHVRRATLTAATEVRPP